MLKSMQTANQLCPLLPSVPWWCFMINSSIITHSNSKYIIVWMYLFNTVKYWNKHFGRNSAKAYISKSNILTVTLCFSLQQHSIHLHISVGCLIKLYFLQSSFNLEYWGSFLLFAKYFSNYWYWNFQIEFKW